MAIQIQDRTISRILIVEDDEASRHSYEYSIEECDVQPVPEPGPIDDLDAYIDKTVANGIDAAISDYQLRGKAYAAFDGAMLVSRWYKHKFPALLVTKWEDAAKDEIRRYRQRIPVLISPDELDPDTLRHGLDRCIRELSGDIAPSRKPWRTLVRVEEVEQEESLHKRVYVIVPAWDPNEVFSVFFKDLPEAIQKSVAQHYRCHAQINLGAESEKELFFSDWEPGS